MANRKTRRAAASIRRSFPFQVPANTGGFAIGQLVKLRCGGADMVVEVLEGALVICSWHDSQLQPRSAKYQQTSLVPA